MNFYILILILSLFFFSVIADEDLSDDECDHHKSTAALDRTKICEGAICPEYNEDDDVSVDDIHSLPGYLNCERSYEDGVHGLACDEHKSRCADGLDGPACDEHKSRCADGFEGDNCEKKFSTDALNEDLYLCTNSEHRWHILPMMQKLKKREWLSEIPDSILSNPILIRCVYNPHVELIAYFIEHGIIVTKGGSLMWP